MPPLIFFLLACFASFGIILVRKYFYGKISRSKKLYPIILFVYLFVLVLLLYFFIPLSYPSITVLQNKVWLALGLILIYAGIGFFSWAYLYLGFVGTLGGASLGLKDELITTGPYRYTRNPQYLGILLFLFGFSILTQSLYLILFSFLWVILFYVLAVTEEKELEAAFGEEYVKYKKEAPMFFFK